MTGHRPLIAGVALVTALALAAVLWRSYGPAGQDSSTGAVPGDAVSTAGPGSTGAPAAGDEAASPMHPNAPVLPLPELETPLRLVVDDLTRRAEAGDAPAACRLAAEFERCNALRAQLHRQQASRQRMEAHLDRVPEQEIENIARALAGMDQAQAVAMQAIEHCAGVEEPGAAQRARYWRTAALAGHAPAMRHYAIGNAFRFGDLMGALPELEAYRREAEAIALRAAAAGDAAMIHALAMAYLPQDGMEGGMAAASGFRPFLAQVVRPDPRQALAWLYALQQHPGVRDLPETHPIRVLPAREIDGLTSRLAPGEVAAASAAATDRVRAWPPEAADAIRVAVHGNGGIGDVIREECDPGRAGGPSAGSRARWRSGLP